jgi:hypothetical protein
MAILSDEPIVYDGTPVNPSGITPFGLFDDDAIFQSDAPKIANYVANRLGYPVLDVELVDKMIYTCFEEAIMTYGSQVNQFQAREHMLTLQGLSTGSTLTQKNITGTALQQLVRIASDYGTEAQSGGDVEVKKGYISASAYTQSYDLKTLWSDAHEGGKAIEIRRVYHYMPSAVARYYDPFATTGLGLTNLMSEFGFDGYSPPVTFVMMPAYEDLLRIQAIEVNDMIRKSQYSFEISNNVIRFSPIFKKEATVWFDYMVVDDKQGPNQTFNTSSAIVADYSNVPYSHIPYYTINSIGKNWIFRYTLALAKETLGNVRGKYDNVPIPDQIIKLDGDLLRREGKDERELLIKEIRDTLEQTGLQAQMKKQAENAKMMQEMFNKVPTLIYIG